MMSNCESTSAGTAIIHHQSLFNKKMAATAMNSKVEISHNSP
jgi:hypothetical protein